MLGQNISALLSWNWSIFMKISPVSFADNPEMYTILWYFLLSRDKRSFTLCPLINALYMHFLHASIDRQSITCCNYNREEFKDINIRNKNVFESKCLNG